jgi:hypothetical protein
LRDDGLALQPHPRKHHVAGEGAGGIAQEAENIGIQHAVDVDLYRRAKDIVFLIRHIKGAFALARQNADSPLQAVGDQEGLDGPAGEKAAAFGKNPAGQAAFVTARVLRTCMESPDSSACHASRVVSPA